MNSRPRSRVIGSVVRSSDCAANLPRATMTLGDRRSGETERLALLHFVRLGLRFPGGRHLITLAIHVFSPQSDRFEILVSSRPARPTRARPDVCRRPAPADKHETALALPTPNTTCRRPRPWLAAVQSPGRVWRRASAPTKSEPAEPPGPPGSSRPVQRVQWVPPVRRSGGFACRVDPIPSTLFAEEFEMRAS